MGIINGMQQPAQGGMPQQPQVAPAKPTDPKTAYQRVILASTKIIYNPETMKAILDIIRKAKTPEVGLANATILVMAKLSEASKNTMPQAVKTPAAKGIMALIAELAEKAGIIKNAQQAVKAASQMIAQAIMQAAKGGAQPKQPPTAQPMQPMNQPMQPQMGA